MLAFAQLVVAGAVPPLPVAFQGLDVAPSTAVPSPAFLSGGSGGRTRSSCYSACGSGLVGLCGRRLWSGLRLGLLRLGLFRLLLCLRLWGSSGRLLLRWGRSAHLL